MAITQLQQLASDVAQDDNISSNWRLRKEEMRRRYSDNWTAPAETQKQRPTSLIDSTKQDTLAKTYSALKNNYDLLLGGMDGGSYSGEQSTTSPTSSRSSSTNDRSSAPLSGTPNSLPGYVGTALALSGLGQYSTLAKGALEAAQGRPAAVAGTLAGLFTNQITEGKVPGLPGVASALASGLVGDKSREQIGMDVVNSLFGSALSISNPLAGLAYSGLRALGFDPAYGLNNLFGVGLEGVPRGFEGTLGGFFGRNALGQGIGDPNSSYGGTPAGYSEGDLGSGINGGFGLGAQTGIGYGSSLGGLQGAMQGTFSSDYGGSYSDSGYNGGSYGGGTGDFGGAGPGDAGW